MSHGRGRPPLLITDTDTSSDESSNWQSSDSSFDSDSDEYSPEIKKHRKNENSDKEIKPKSEVYYEFILKTNYKWIIKDYIKTFADLKHGQVIESPIITAGTNDEYKFQLLFYPKVSDGNKKYVSLYLVLKQSEEPKLMIHFKSNFFNVHHHLENHNEVEECISVGHKIGFRRLMKSVEFEDSFIYRNSGYLGINCDISVVLKKPDRSKIKVVNDLESLLDSGDFSDCTLEVQDKKFKVHKYILAARSVVFAAMFKHEMKEKKENSVKIIDFSAEVIEELLNFIYTGNVKNLSGQAKDLLAVAEMYNLKDLKQLCEDELSKNLCVSNVVEILNFADLHNSAVLKEQALNYLVNHAKEVVETKPFQEMTAQQSPLLGLIIVKMAKNEK